MRRLLRATALAGAIGALAAPNAHAELAVWMDADELPSVQPIGVVYGVTLFNDDQYDVPFYRVFWGTRVRFQGEVMNDIGGDSVGSTVYIYKKTRGAKRLVPVTSVKTGTGGRFLYKAPRTGIETWYVAFAVGSPRRRGETPPAISNPVFVRVAPKLLVPRSIRSTGDATVAGRIVPSTTGTVQLWKLNGKRAKRLATKKISHSGRFSFGLSFDASGAYEFAVVASPTKKSGYIVNAKPVTVNVSIPVPAPPPPPAQSYEPPAATAPQPTANEPSREFGGPCSARGCDASVRSAQLEAIGDLLVKGAPIPIALLPKPVAG